MVRPSRSISSCQACDLRSGRSRRLIAYLVASFDEIVYV